MATLEIEFNCMCAFVPEEYVRGAGTVHVLMPATQDHSNHDEPQKGDNDRQGHDGHPVRSDGPEHQGYSTSEAPGEHEIEAERAHGGTLHVVRMVHPTFRDEPKGRSMDGWALVLGTGLAETTLEPAQPSRLGAELIDLFAFTSREVPRRLIQDSRNPEVNARVTLGAGMVQTTRAEATWLLNQTPLRMAHQVVWRMEGIHPDLPLRWVPLDPRSDPPIRRLSELGPDRDGVFRFSVYHVPENTLPPDPTGVGQLDPEEVTEHFRDLYVLVGVQDPDSTLLPQIEPGAGGKVSCGAAMARLED